MHPPQLLLPKAPHFSIPTETEVGDAALDQDLADQRAATIPDVDSISTAGIHIAIHVTLDAVRHAGISVCEYPPVDEKWRLRYVVVEQGVGVDSGCFRGIEAAVAVDGVRVGDVKGLFVWRKCYTIWAAKTVCYGPNVACRWHKAVDVLGKTRFGPKSLLIAINGICEPNRAVGVDHNVIRRVERTRMIVVDEGTGPMWSLGFHVYKTRRFVQRSLSAQDETVPVIRAPIGHVVALWTPNLVAREVRRREELDASHDNGLIGGGYCIRGWVGNLIGRDEESIGFWEENARFMEKRGALIIDEAFELRRSAQEREKGVVVDEKGAGL